MASTVPTGRLQLRLEPAPTVPAAVRRRLSRELPAWGVGPDALDAVLMVCTELVTNAVEHAGTDLELTVEPDGADVLISVRDRCPADPRLQPHRALARRGRGLQMVEALAREWAWTPHPDGKTVWARVPVDP
ncbi:MAG: ATP-binding protein [Pseudonocardia sp.]|nr:ATP-binding protein [Pseudonocardia sp.]